MREIASYTGRLAPTPSGLLHLGHVRTFAVAHARAQAAGGVLRLRIDDLDPERSRPEYAAAAERDLLWLGLRWQGELVRQSLRGAAYRAAWARLVEAGWVYPCRCTRRQLRGIARAPHEERSAGAPPESAGHAGEEDETLYPGTCRPAWLPGSRDGTDERLQWLGEGPEGRNWRFRVPAGEAVCWQDGGFGAQRFVAGEQFGDFGLWRRDGVAAYQLATVVDDAEMRVTEVVRGADLLVSTARQILLFRALGLAVPAFFHCPLVRDADGNRLAKRTDALSVATLRERGVSAAEVLRLAAGCG